MDMAATELTAADFATIAGNLRAATGGAAPQHAWQMMAELADACGPGDVGAAGGAAAGAESDAAAEAGGARVVAAIEAAMALAPRDPLEAMLAVQMAAVHAAAMRCLRRAAECAAWPHIEARYLREATRLMHLFVRQAEALDRRGGRRARGAADGAGTGDAVARQGAAEPRHPPGDPRDTAERCEHIAAIFARRAAEARAEAAALEAQGAGGGADAADGERGTEPAKGGETPPPGADARDPAAEPLEAFVARLYARQRERLRAEAEQGTADGDRGSGIKGGSDPRRVLAAAGHPIQNEPTR